MAQEGPVGAVRTLGRTPQHTRIPRPTRSAGAPSRVTPSCRQEPTPFSRECRGGPRRRLPQSPAPRQSRAPRGLATPRRRRSRLRARRVTRPAHCERSRDQGADHSMHNMRMCTCMHMSHAHAVMHMPRATGAPYTPHARTRYAHAVHTPCTRHARTWPRRRRRSARAWPRCCRTAAATPRASPCTALVRHTW